MKKYEQINWPLPGSVGTLGGCLVLDWVFGPEGNQVEITFGYHLKTAWAIRTSLTGQDNVRQDEGHDVVTILHRWILEEIAKQS